MSDNEKARPGEATPEQAQGMNEAAEETTSVFHNTTGQERGQGIKASQIQEEYGYTPRELRRLVNFERVAHGLLICSGRRGYFFGDDREVQDTINRLRRMAASDIEVADAMERSLRRRQGQQVMDEWL